MKTIFVAGTDTGVGKTEVAAALSAAFVIRGYRVGVMKPISCGGREDAYRLMSAAGVGDPVELVNPIALKEPLSPNVASSIEGRKIDVSSIRKAQAILAEKGYDYLVVEGCGGLLVPVRRGFFVVDLIRMMKAGTVLVSRSGLGAINHSLLSLEALRRRGIEPLGIIFNRTSGGPLGTPEKTNPSVVAKTGHLRSLGMLPYLRKGLTDRRKGQLFLKHIDFKKIVC